MKLSFILLSWLFLIIVGAGQAQSKLNSKKTLEIIPIAQYNSQYGCFQFSDKTHFNQYLEQVEGYIEALNIEDETSSSYMDFENNFGHSSLMTEILTQEELFIETDVWSEENDPDNHHIQDEALRLIMNKHSEIIVNRKLITLVDLCTYIEIDAKVYHSVEGKKDVEQKRKLVASKSFKNLSKSSPIKNYCLENSINEERSSSDCCDKNDRDTRQYHQYSSTRKMKAVFFQRNIWFLGYYKMGAKTKSYKKKNNGNWKKTRADEIYAFFNGTIYGSVNLLEPCTFEQHFGPWDKYRENRKKAKIKEGIGNNYWTKNGSMESYHRVADNGAVGVVTLCLNTDKCGGCESNVYIGDPVPLSPFLNGPSLICNSPVTYYIDGTNNPVSPVTWTVSNGLETISSSQTQITVDPINSAASGSQTITAEYSSVSIAKNVWKGHLNLGDLHIQSISGSAIYRLTYLNQANVSELEQISWQILTTSGNEYLQQIPEAPHQVYLYNLPFGGYFNTILQIDVTGPCSTTIEYYQITLESRSNGTTSKILVSPLDTKSDMNPTIMRLLKPN